MLLKYLFLGVLVAHYLQSVSKNVALGAELVYQKLSPQHGGQTAYTSLAARYTGNIPLITYHM